MGAAPVECEVFELGVSDRRVPGLRVSSFHRRRAPLDPEELSVQYFLDFGDLTPVVLGTDDDTFESIRLTTYESHPEFRPAVYRPTDDSLGPGLPDIPPTVFSLFVRWKEGGISLMPQSDSSE